MPKLGLYRLIIILCIGVPIALLFQKMGPKVVAYKENIKANPSVLAGLHRTSVVQKSSPSVISVDSREYLEYINFFKKVFKTFEDNYYLVPDKKIYEHFLEKFKTHIFASLKSEGRSNDYVRWRSAWYLADALKSKDDRFTQFYPPKPADKFKHEALGQKIDLGIEGKKTGIGFLVTRMEPRSDAYEKGLREGDLILQINDLAIGGLSQEDIENKLTPVANTRVRISYLANETKIHKSIEAVSKEYFKQTVFLHDVSVPGVFCLELRKFNQATPDDMFRFLRFVEAEHPKGLVLDLRGNPGGPPLAAEAISGFFLKGGEEFTYFKKRNSSKMELDVPAIDPQYQFRAPMVVLVDADTGSAAELFSGILQFRKRAIVLGVNTAGQILLKSMFPMGDGSMLALVVSRGFYPDGTVFGFDGITPNNIIKDAPKDGLINLAAALIAMKNR
ncbi:MAG: PDZ domain-containing protein [Candidatus Omnitrophica bacterium]|nr:PDZ domain-containing protein [Candidatus Omnitrophota bacterium]